MTIKLLVKIGVISVIITVLGGIGYALNQLIPFIWLTYFFVIIRKMAELFDFMIDLPTLFTTTGIMLSAYVIYWSWKAFYAITSKFIK